MKWELIKQSEPHCYDLYDGETCIGEIKTDSKTAVLIESAPLLFQIGEAIEKKIPEPQVAIYLLSKAEYVVKKIKETKGEKFIRNNRDGSDDAGNRLYDGKRDLTYESRRDGYRLEILKGLVSNESLYERHTRYEMVQIANEMAHLLLTFEEKERNNS